MHLPFMTAEAMGSMKLVMRSLKYHMMAISLHQELAILETKMLLILAANAAQTMFMFGIISLFAR